MGLFTKVKERLSFKKECTALRRQGIDFIPVYFYKKHSNWGDALNQYLISKLSGKEVVYCPPNAAEKHVFAIGSIMNKVSSNSIVWGTGMSRPSHAPENVSPEIKAVRGPKSRQALLSKGHKVPEVYGDPAIILPRIYHPEITKTHKLGVIPHYIDKESAIVQELSQKSDIKIIDIQQGIEVFIDDVLACENILSSSLHGLIAADAYGIPSGHLKFSENVVGGSFKFEDYYLGIGFNDYQPINIEDVGDLAPESLIKLCRKKMVPAEVVERLIKVAPFEVLY